MAWYHIVFGLALIVLAVLIVLFVLLQEGNEQGLGAISGGSSESFFGKNKGRTDEAKKAGWIALLNLTKCVLEDCIDVLGFSAPERM